MPKNVEEHLAFYEEVGRRIRDARRRRKPPLTQEGLAKLVGLTRTSITNIEHGRQKLLMHTFSEIASVLQAEPASLMPVSEPQLEELAAALKSRPVEEKVWIMTAVTAAQENGEDVGS